VDGCEEVCEDPEPGEDLVAAADGRKGSHLWPLGEGSAEPTLAVLRQIDTFELGHTQRVDRMPNG